ncbi:stAR-related lipid transfer protein [Paratrimastix pyriformis]|uniref:StAR-related lipid transfer protein n=1 Tax=Paratrimastix pyriformis TaxID=342808 RepID=A0ABQ8UAG4_9EUKA|nr:stAR-related lipid transfer protein [Paratrimastix pyriformis]
MPFDGEWKLLKENEQCRVYSRDIPDGTGLPEFRGVGDIDGISPWELGLVMRDYAFRRNWDNTTLQQGMLANPEPDFWLSYNLSAPSLGGMISARDFTDFQFARADSDGGYTHGGSACDFPEVPPLKGIVRGNNSSCGVRMQPIPGAPDKVRLHYVIRSDLRGSLPRWVVNKAMGGVIADFYAKLQLNLPKRDRSRYPPRPEAPGQASHPGFQIPRLDGTPGVVAPRG